MRCSSYKQLSSVLGFPIEYFKTAKSMGAPGFIASSSMDAEVIGEWINIHIEEIKEGCKDIQEESLAAWKTRLTAAQAKREELLLEKERGRYIQREEVSALIKSLAAAQNTILNARLTQELPQKLFGLSVPEITKLLEVTAHEIVSIMKNYQLPPDESSN